MENNTNNTECSSVLSEVIPILVDQINLFIWKKSENILKVWCSGFSNVLLNDSVENKNRKQYI